MNYQNVRVASTGTLPIMQRMHHAGLAGERIEIARFVVATENPLNVSAAGIGAFVVAAEELASLSREVRELRRKLAEVEKSLGRTNTRECREMSDADARAAIAVLFKTRDGVVLYPSDVADELQLDYDQVVRLIDELTEEGKIARA